VTPLYIVTSAACVQDVEFMYAIAGYKKYVPFDQIDTDPCTKEMKKKIVFTCVPKCKWFLISNFYSNKDVI
jgi:hypothetical protein